MYRGIYLISKSKIYTNFLMGFYVTVAVSTSIPGVGLGGPGGYSRIIYRPIEYTIIRFGFSTIREIHLLRIVGKKPHVFGKSGTFAFCRIAYCPSSVDTLTRFATFASSFLSDSVIMSALIS